MAFLKVFRVPKNQKFNYKPRHWDPQKEEFDERRRQAEERRKSGAAGAKARIASEFRRGKGGGDARFRQQQVFRSNMLLFGIVLFLLLTVYVLIQIYMPQLLDLLK
jgi:hypothetical protein